MAALHHAGWYGVFILSVFRHKKRPSLNIRLWQIPKKEDPPHAWQYYTMPRRVGGGRKEWERGKIGRKIGHANGERAGRLDK
jgi:hypothetical protein